MIFIMFLDVFLMILTCIFVKAKLSSFYCYISNKRSFNLFKVTDITKVIKNTTIIATNLFNQIDIK